jgi:butyrate kinase
VYEVARLEARRLVIDEHIVSAIVDHSPLQHASNLGIPLAAALARRLNVPAFAVDPVVVDELSPVAAISGFAPVQRRSLGHVLSVKAASRRAARRLGRDVGRINLVVAHLGGGITIAAVQGGRITDANIALLGDGPFTPQRAGCLPLGDVIELCYSDEFSQEELQHELSVRGGMHSYLGTHDVEEVERRIDSGDEKAALVVDAMIYRVANYIGAMSVALEGRIDAVAVTGGMARSRRVVSEVRRRVSHLAPVLVFPGSLEMEAMAEGARRALDGDEPVRRWSDYAPET